jgi:hypothetical protein
VGPSCHVHTVQNFTSNPEAPLAGPSIHCRGPDFRQLIAPTQFEELDRGSVPLIVLLNLKLPFGANRYDCKSSEDWLSPSF